jgi:hypothetical protein
MGRNHWDFEGVVLGDETDSDPGVSGVENIGGTENTRHGRRGKVAERGIKMESIGGKSGGF